MSERTHEPSAAIYLRIVVEAIRSGSRPLTENDAQHLEHAAKIICDVSAERDAMNKTQPPADDLAVPSEPGGFVGDIFFGDPQHSCRGTHKWTGKTWEKLPDETEVLIDLLATARASEARLHTMCDELAEAVEKLTEIIDIGVSVNISDEELSSSHPEDRSFIRRTRKALERARTAYAKYQQEQGR